MMLGRQYGFHLTVVAFLLVLAAPLAARGDPIIAPIGVNKFDLLMQYLGVASGGDGTSRYRRVTSAMANKSLDDARSAGVEFVRVSISGFSPYNYGAKGDLTIWRDAPAKFWSAVDQMFDELDKRSMRIVPVLMWNPKQFPAICEETIGDLLKNPDSRSWQLLERFATEFVTRYRDRDTILFYELSNELNLGADLNMVVRCHREWGSANCGMVSNYSTAELIDFTRRFVAVIKRHDQKHLISSGFSIPRGAAEHLRRQPGWSKGGADWTIDSPSDFIKNLTEIHVATDIISIHLYDKPQNYRFGHSSAVQLLELAQQAASLVGKPLFLGEFGDLSPEIASEGAFTETIIKEMRRLGVRYGAVWIWEFYQKRPYNLSEEPPPHFSLEPGFTDYLINQIKHANMAEKTDVRRTIDTVPPNIIVTWPLDCSVLTSESHVHAVASDFEGAVAKVDFEMGVLRFSDTSPPYEWVIPREELPTGAAVISASAFDAAGNRATWTTYVYGRKYVGGGSCTAPDF